MFIGRELAMPLFVEDIRSSEDGGYVLLGSDKNPSSDEEPVLVVTLKCSERFLDKLSEMKIGDGIRTQGIIDEVEFRPELEQLEQIKRDPQVRLAGVLASIR
jgi:hypothetical protein